jgi:predicted Fe-S protein YdhL (DUF1289 family)
MLIRSPQQLAQAGHVKSTSSIPSPCIKVCTIENDHCLGCGRSTDEIKEWFYCDDQRKLEIIEQIGKRIPDRV